MTDLLMPPKSRFTEEDILELAQMYEEAGFDNDPPPAWYTARYGKQTIENAGLPDTVSPQYDEVGEFDPYNQTPYDNLLTRPTGAPLRFRTKDLKETHKYGCLMLLLPLDVRKQITDWTLGEVPDFHLASEGRELGPHVTLVYGFEDEENLVSDLQSLLQRWGPLRIRLAPTLSLFEGNKDGDVLKIGVESERLHEMHRAITTLFDCPGDKSPDYKPHLTLAYLNPDLGVSDTYAALCTPFLGREIQIEEAEYSAADGTKTRFRLGFLPLLGSKGSRPPRTPKFNLTRGEQGELKGHALRHLSGHEYGLYKTGEEAHTAARQLSKEEGEYAPVEVYGDPESKMLGVKPHAINKVLAWDDAMSDGGGHGQFICACGRVIRQCRCRATAERPQRVYHITDQFCRECSNRSKALEPPTVPTTAERPPEPAAEAQREPPQHELPPPKRQVEALPPAPAIQNPKVAPAPSRMPIEGPRERLPQPEPTPEPETPPAQQSLRSDTSVAPKVAKLPEKQRSDGETQAAIQEAPVSKFTSIRRAPSLGVTLGGEFFEAGTPIPDEVFAEATDDEREQYGSDQRKSANKSAATIAATKSKKGEMSVWELFRLQDVVGRLRSIQENERPYLDKLKESMANGIKSGQEIILRPTDPGKYTMEDGHHRLVAAMELGMDSFPVRIGEKGSRSIEGADTEASDKPSEEEPTPKVNTNTKEFKKWFGDSKVVDDEGQPLVVYHGTSGTFDEFNAEAGSDKGNFGYGPGVFFTLDPDAARSYANQELTLADKQQVKKIDKARETYRDGLQALGEKIEDRIPEGSRAIQNWLNDALDEGRITREEYDRIGLLEDELSNAKGEVYDSEAKPNVVAAYLNMRNPRIVDANRLNWDIVVPRVLQDIDRSKYDGVIFKNIRDNGGSGETITTTYFVFKPTQIKSADNKGGFDPDNPNIYKSMSWLGSGNGGDLVAPPRFMGIMPRKRRPSLLANKSIVAPHIKSRGIPCKRGEAASRTGCIPQEKPTPRGQQTQQAVPEEVEAEMTPTEVRTRPTPAPERSRAARGPKTVALDGDSPHKKLLRSLPIKHRQPLEAGGMNEGKELLTLSDGTKAVYKPAAGEPQARPSIPAGTFYLREAAASALADILGFGDLVPPTVVRDGGSLQRFVSGATIALAAPPDEDFGSNPEDAARAAVFDYIMGAGDRHHGNWMLKNGKIALIDNGLTLPTRRDIADYADVEFFRHADENDLPMPDVSKLQGKWPQAEKALGDLSIEPEAIALAKERYDIVASGRYGKVADLPNPLNPNKGSDLRRFTRIVELLSNNDQRNENEGGA